MVMPPYGKGRRRKRDQHAFVSPPQPQVHSNRHVSPASNTALRLSASSPHVASPLAPSLPPQLANPGWPGHPGPYPQLQSMIVTAQPSISPQTGPLSVHVPPTGQISVMDQNKQQQAKWKSSLNLPGIISAPVNAASALQNTTAGYMNQSAALCDLISSKLSAVITSIDGEVFSGDERELVVYQAPVSASTTVPVTQESSRSANDKTPVHTTSANYFSKVWLYANSRLPPHLPPLKVYMPTWPLLCLAAQYSERVYARPAGAEREAHVDADWRHGTKAMVLKSIPIDDMNTVIFAIRGSQTFMDWAVNFRPAPASPDGFLDDAGNLCHSGFLHVARQMVAPVSARLRTLLQENPSRSSCSLLITGHSAGGAVAQLLYAHMLSTSVPSELNHLTAFFKRVHCVTFGAPPVSLLPLQKPTDTRYKKSLFFSFINEGDPVPRADKAVLRSLIKLYTSPLPGVSCLSNLSQQLVSAAVKPPKSLRSDNRPQAGKAASWPASPAPLPVWKTPASTLSCAGRLILLRDRSGNIKGEDIEARVVTDEQLREVVFGDPVCHMMKLYARRVEVLATRAVTAKETG